MDVFSEAQWRAGCNEEAVRSARRAAPAWLSSPQIDILPVDVSPGRVEEAQRALASAVAAIGAGLEVRVEEDLLVTDVYRKLCRGDIATYVPPLIASLSGEFNRFVAPQGIAVPLAKRAGHAPTVVLTAHSYARMGTNPKTGKHLDFKAVARADYGLIIIPTGPLDGYADKNSTLLYHEAGHLLGFHRAHHDTMPVDSAEDGIIRTRDVPYSVAGEDRQTPCAMRQALEERFNGYCGRCLATLQSARRNVMLHRMI